MKRFLPPSQLHLAAEGILYEQESILDFKAAHVPAHGCR